MDVDAPLWRPSENELYQHQTPSWRAMFMNLTVGTLQTIPINESAVISAFMKTTELN